MFSFTRSITVAQTLLAVTLVFAARAQEHDADGPWLCRDGKAAAVIVTALSPPPCVPVAARELQDHVEKMTGVRLDMVAADTETDLERLTGGRTPILVGASRFTRALGLQATDLASEGYTIHVTPDLAAIVGNDGPAYGPNYRFATDSAGTLYGVYRLLEELGVRWFYPTDLGTVIPDRTGALQLPLLELRDAPFFAYRHTQYGNVGWGRRTGAGGDRDVWSTRHTCSIQLRERYRDAHPEWFLPNVDGHPGHQADLANPQVVQAIARMAAERFESTRPAGTKYYLVIPLDGRARRADDARSQWVASAVLQVARQLRSSHPDGHIVYCAYNDYRLPPADLAELPDNVVVLIALSRGELLDTRSRERSYDLVRRWQAARPQAIYFCRYNGGRLGMVPALIPHVIADDLRTLRQLSEQGPTPLRGEMNFVGIKDDDPHSWWEHLNEYIAAKLLWNPAADVDALLDDVCRRFFGPAAGPMRNVLERCEQTYLDPAQRCVFAVETVDRIEDDLERARALALGTTYQPAVAFVDRGVEPLRMMRRKQLQVQGPVAAAGALAPARHYPFDALTAEGTSADASGSVAQLHRVEQVDGLRGSAVRFPHADSFVRMDPVDLSNTDYSIEAWVKPETMAPGRQFIVGPDAWERQLLMIEYGLPTIAGHSGRVVLKHRQWQGGRSVKLVSAPLEFIAGRWVHIIGTFSRTSGMSIYVDAQLVGLNLELTAPSDMTAIYIGASGNGATHEPSDVFCVFQGVIDDVKIHTRELSYAEVKAAHRQLAPRD